jgi:hypothetical protein
MWGTFAAMLIMARCVTPESWKNGFIGLEREVEDFGGVVSGSSET